MIPIFDLHCDLLGCIEHNGDKLNFESPETNCSLLQLEQGGIRLQTFALFVASSKGGVSKALRQVALYQKLLEEYRGRVSAFRDELTPAKVHGVFSIENASALVEEEEPLERAFERFDAIARVEKILYLSLTWNEENRFGGGNLTQVGLKEEGKALLDFLAKKGVAIDLSHTSDRLAEGILNYIDQRNLPIIPIASHSNFRAVKNAARNLPDELASEIIRRKGVVGLNFVHRFVGDHPDDLLKHLEHALKLGGEDFIALGADYYGALDLLPNEKSAFFPEYPNSSAMQLFLQKVKERFSEQFMEKLAMKNAEKIVMHSL